MLATELEKNVAFDLPGSWQVRAIAYLRGRPFHAVMLSVIAHTYETEGAIAVLTMADPDYCGRVPTPTLLSCGKVDKDGSIVADVGERDGSISKDQLIFTSKIQMRDIFRQLADRLKLNDADRIEMFKCAERWLVADRRYDPTFDPRDPDAYRLVN